VRKIAIITYIPFWRKGAGYCSRLQALVDFLCRYFSVTVVFGGVGDENDMTIVHSQSQNLDIFFLDKDRVLTFEQYGSRVQCYFEERTFHFCIIEYVHLSFLLNYLPKGLIKILDTHDVIFKRHESFAMYGMETYSRALAVVDYNKDEEVRLYQSYDAVIVITEQDHRIVTDLIPGSKVILAPHPAPLNKRTPRESVTTVGFIGSSYYPNVDAIELFVREVWPEFHKSNVNLRIYGSVGTKLKGIESDRTQQKIMVHGFVPDLDTVYTQIDIAINPVRFGAGLKIKNVEALCNGLPLITTSHGAIGMERGIDVAFLVADDFATFKLKLRELMDDRNKRMTLCESAYEFANNYFTQEKCFGELMQFLKSHM
jgi:glycosyltransferase involved in cell wall biosynthesis